VAAEAEAIRASGHWRHLSDYDPHGSDVSFASNDYLGLSTHPAVTAAVHDAVDRWGAGAGSARLVVGSRPIHSELEAELAAWKGDEAALVFASGFTTNLGVLTTFAAGPDTLVLSDELNHASIVDGCRLARGQVAVYRHCDLDHVAFLLDGAPDAATVVVSDTVFSMDGDVAPVAGLAEICAARGALLVLDEAHAVLGPEPELDGLDHLRVGTLSKTLGSLGGFVTGPRSFVELIVNRARPFIFTTALSPADAAAGQAALRVLRSSEGDRLRSRLRALVERVRPGHSTPIVPVVLGDEATAVAAAAALLERGLRVPAIRPPTVPAGTSRLRVTLSAAHRDDDVDRLVAALADVTRPTFA
jgi:8-amino-7-oxononanoate synthase